MYQDLQPNIEFVNQYDPEIAALMGKELARQQRNIELIASENIASPAVIAAMGTILTNKYAEGYPGKRYYGGCEYVDEVECIAIERAKQLFGAEYANVQPHSGAQANLEAYQALLQPGDTVVGMSLANGGHLTHGSPVNASGKLYHFIPYGVDPATGRIDYDEVEQLVKENRPKLVVAGASAYPRTIDFKSFGEIAHRYGALLMVDMAHISGLVAGGAHMSPVPYADVVTTTTHKTLRGPRGGLILAKEEWAKKLNSAVFPGTQGGPLMHVIAAKAVALGEALKPEFKEYGRQVMKNAAVLAEELEKRGLRIVSGGTESHVMLVDLRPKHITGKAAEAVLGAAHITVNKNAIHNDPEKPFVTSGIRLGTPAMTTRGFKEAEMRKTANLIADLLDAPEDAAVLERVRQEVDQLTALFPVYRV